VEKKGFKVGTEPFSEIGFKEREKDSWALDTSTSKRMFVRGATSVWMSACVML
jgi:hypothetical protein